ncbi:hypothetical protein Hte_007792 [Hypoxylon texense]
MASHSNAEQVKPKEEVSTSDIISDVEEDTESEPDVNEDTDSDYDEEEEMKKWLSARYTRGSEKPMKEPLTVSWGLPISDADVEKLKVGFRSQSMDDKWSILVEEPDENGNLSIHIIRWLVHEECYILHIVPKPSNNDGGSAIIQSITWEGNKAGLQCDAEQAQKEAVILCRGHLHCEFEALPHYPRSMFYDQRHYRKLAAE